MRKDTAQFSYCSFRKISRMQQSSAEVRGAAASLTLTAMTLKLHGSTASEYSFSSSIVIIQIVPNIYSVSMIAK